MAKKGSDPRVEASEQNVTTQKAVNQALSDMGLQDADDLGSGRADFGLIAQRMNQPEPELDPDAIEEAQRDAQWEAQVQEPGQPYQPILKPSAPAAAAPEQEPATEIETPTLAQLQAERDAAQAEAKRMKEQYARESERWGNERKKVAERLARLEQGGGGGSPSMPQFQQAQPGYYDPRILGDTDPNAPLSAGQTAALLHSMASAFGQQLSAREQNVIEAAREMRNYDLTSNEEADLIERHGWLATLDRASQIKAMRDLVQPLRAASQPAAGAPMKPQGVNMEALARARHLTATTFIEPSSRGSTQEQQAATGVDSALAKKIAEYKEAMALRPGMTGYEGGQYGENKKAERLLREINALQRRRA